MKYPKPRKPSRKKLVKNLDTVFSKFIRKRDGSCVQCGKKSDLTCGHLFSRVAYSTRWDELNCHCQCTGHNMYHEHNAAPFTLWFIHKFGLSKYELLYHRHQHTSRVTNEELQLLALHYQGLIQ